MGSKSGGSGLFAACLASVLLSVGSLAQAQTVEALLDVARPPAPAPSVVLPLYPSVAPGSESWTQVEKTVLDTPTGGRQVRNVTSPAIAVYLPAPGKAVGLGVIVAPGGAFRFLSYDEEGVRVARWLADHGIVGIVLKYRVLETDPNVVFGPPPPGAPPAPPSPPGPLPGETVASADGVKAMEIVRRHAAEWGLKPDRIGIMGFSAGGYLAVDVAVALAGKDAPLFVAPIYGGALYGSPRVPADGLAPMFVAVASDDKLVGPKAHELYSDLRAAGQHPEFHVYHRGGHGFGMKRHDDTADHWIDEFYWWLGSNGWLTPAP